MKLLSNAITSDDLRSARCSSCGDVTGRCEDELFLHSRCHPSAGTRVSYVRAHHALFVACRKCQAPVVTIKLPVLS